MDDLELEDDSAAMAAMMGFSDFGAQNNPSKKRKFNAATDAYIEGNELEKIDRGGKKGQGSGGNQIPLGKMRVIGVKGGEGRNEKEIDLGDEEEEGVRDGNGDAGDAAEDVNENGDGDENEGPRYVDTSAPPPIFDEIEGREHARGQDDKPTDPAVEEERRKAQEQIDAILAAASTNPSLDTNPPQTTPVQTRPHALPERPVHNTMGFTGGAGAAMERGGGGAGSRSARSDAGSIASSRPPSGRGNFNKKWYEGYYDPSFNENPWAKLEVERGLQAKGTWVWI